MDPTLNLFGTNDQAGDYRSSGCTACHVVYANDRSPVRAGQYAAAGNQGRTRTSDPMIPKGESGHPIAHTFTNSIPTSQCMVCHMHPGTNMVASYLGLTWWDNETDGIKMYPAVPAHLSSAQRVAVENRNPEGSALRGLWSDPAFLERTGTAEFNAGLTKTQFADFHGHGWLFRAVFKRDRHGTLLDAFNHPVPEATPQQLADAVGYRNLPPLVGDDGATGMRRAGRTRRSRRCGACRAAGASQGHSSRARDALHRLPLCPGQPRQRQSLRRNAKRRGDRLCGLSWHSPGAGGAAHLRSGGAARRRSGHQPHRSDHAIRRSAFRSRSRRPWRGHPALDGDEGPAVDRAAGGRFDRSESSAI